MKKLIATAVIACAGAAVMLAQTGTAVRSQTPAAPASAAVGAQKTRTVQARERNNLSSMGQQVLRRLSQLAQPAAGVRSAGSREGEPRRRAGKRGAWERVLRKLSVRAMPPQGMTRPQETEYAGFTTWLANSLDQAWVSRGASPGVYVVHRLNRTEYGNAVRDLLAIDVDVTSLLPSDGGEFGFDNIAVSLKTSPMLLEGFVTAAQRISTLAMGDPKALPGTTEYSISPRLQPERIHRGAAVLARAAAPSCVTSSRRTGEYKLAARLFRGVEEGYVGVEGNDTPNTFVITIDGDEVFSTTIGGPKDHEEQSKSLTETQPLLDARMTARVKVTAGPHDVAFTWRDRPSQRQDVFQPALRDSQEVHMVGGFPRIRTAMIEGPYNVTGVSATPSRDRIFVCRPASSTEETHAPNGSSPT